MNTWESSEIFDGEALGEADFQFGIVADTHATGSQLSGAEEFPSRGLQGRRVQAVLALLRELPMDFIIHMGDFVQEYPEAPGFRESFEDALEGFKTLGVPLYAVAGNHDIGDKPDPTMPTHPVAESTLNWYEEKCGPSWYTFSEKGWDFFILNSQILNTGLEAEKAQRKWLESSLNGNNNPHKCLFLHLPLYLGEEDESGLGNYDVIDQASRKWLLELIRKKHFALLGSAHVHFSFYDKVGQAEYRQFASPTFTRPGFSHLFSSAAPEERGRNDRGKLGIHIVRVLRDKLKIHFIRTYGVLSPEELVPPNGRLMIAPSQRMIPSHSGITFLEPLVWDGEVPLTFPSVIRQNVRNDYPFYLLQESGAGHVRIPVTDLHESTIRKRLKQLLDLDYSLTVMILSEDPLDSKYRRLLENLSHPLQIEWQIPGRPHPEINVFREFREYCRQTGHGLSLSPVIPGEHQEGKQHPRTRIGYRIEEMPGLRGFFEEANVFPDRVVAKPAGESRAHFSGFRKLLPPPVSGFDVPVSLSSTNDSDNVWKVALTFILGLESGNTRIFLDPFIDLDRTMDSTHGLCDRNHNPRKGFIALKTLNTLFYPETQKTVPDFNIKEESAETFLFQANQRKYALCRSPHHLWQFIQSRNTEITTYYDLSRGLSYKAAPRPHNEEALPVLVRTD